MNQAASARTRNAGAGCSRRGCHQAATAECGQSSVRLQGWLEGERVLENVAGSRSQAGPGVPVFREGRRNFLVPVAGRCARSRLYMGSTPIKQFNRFSMSFQWHVGLFYTSFVSVLTAVFGRQFLVFNELPSTRRIPFCPRRDAEGRGAPFGVVAWERVSALRQARAGPGWERVCGGKE